MSASSTALRLTRPRPRLAPKPGLAPNLGLLVSNAAAELDAAVRQTGATSWAVEIRTRAHRTQVVHIEHDRVEDRVNMRSLIGPFRVNLGASEFVRLNSEQTLGSICVEDIDRGEGARPYLSVRHSQPRTRDARDLRNALSLIGWSADELERTIFARDVE